MAKKTFLLYQNWCFVRRRVVFFAVIDFNPICWHFRIVKSNIKALLNAKCKTLTLVLMSRLRNYVSKPIKSVINILRVVASCDLRARGELITNIFLSVFANDKIIWYYLKEISRSRKTSKSVCQLKLGVWVLACGCVLTIDITSPPCPCCRKKLHRSNFGFSNPRSSGWFSCW